MWKRIFILSMVCVFVLAAASVGEDRIRVKDDLQKRFDRNRDGFIDHKEQAMLHEFQEARERIEKLCAMAREHEEQAKNFLAEADGLERAIKREFERMEMAEHTEKMHHRIAELREAAEHAEREGHHDKAGELRKNAKMAAKELAVHVMNIEQRKFQETKERLERLRDMAEEAEERGQKEKARHLRAEAEELEHHLKNIAEREDDDENDELEEELEELEDEVKMLRDEVGRLREDIKKLEEIIRHKLMNR